MIRWHCHHVFQQMPAAAVADGIAVVIDVLRASTTMITALAHGAARVVPVAEVAEARRVAASCAPRALLGGERGGQRIPGFDAGNSPAEYSADRVGGRTVVITTTNGTAALAACALAREVLVGALVNRTAVAAVVRRIAIAQGIADVHLVCAGTDGAVSREDVLTAGAILEAAARETAADELVGVARAVLADYRALAAMHAQDLPAALKREFATSPGGRNLIDLGMAADLACCARVDSLAVVPRLDRGDASLHAA